MKFRDDVSSEEGKDFLRIKESGASVRGIFVGEPFDFRMHWIKNGNTNKSVSCGGEGCFHCLGGNRSVFRFRMNFIVKSEDGYQCKVFEQSLKTYESLRSLNKDYPLESTLVKITRNGMGKDTYYSIIPVPGNPVSENSWKKIQSMKLFDLSKMDEPVAASQAGQVPGNEQQYAEEF
jgi:hypothetical protein